jgi:HEAT repeat protein
MFLRLARPLAAVALTTGLVVVAVSGDLAASADLRDAEKYIKDLKSSKDAKVRATALTELGKMGQIQKSVVAPVVSDMMKALEDKEAMVRAAAAKAVGMIDPDPKEAVPALVKLMNEDKQESVRLAAVQGLSAMGPSAKAATKDLRALMQKETVNKKKSRLAREAQTALRSINPPKKKN